MVTKMIRIRLSCMTIVTGLGLVVLFSGCATSQPSVRHDTEVADFYWSYAALAAKIYDTKGDEARSKNHVYLSEWLRDEAVKSGPEARQEYEKTMGLIRLERRTNTVPQDTSGQMNVAVHQSPVTQELDEMQADHDDAPFAKGEEPIQDGDPADIDDCKKWVKGEGAGPLVPITLAQSQHGWQRVRELEQFPATRGWKIFVPDLAIDVWRRNRGNHAEPNVIEYAIVYRGTVGTGGWISNLRVATNLLPLFWDQYPQSRKATFRIVSQIRTLHQEADRILGRKTTVLITAVGHSLGAALARYAYYTTPDITRVVGFNSSPFDGSSLIPIDDRPGMMSHPKRHPPDIDSGSSDMGAAIYLLYEKGDILNRVYPCHSGKVWGQTGGPMVLCESVDLSKGNAVDQHSMGQLACKLALERSGSKNRVRNVAGPNR